MYRAIQLIHRTGSIRQAAGQMAVSPSALNRSVQAFEEELGFDVFDRITGGVRLSGAGELLLNVIDRHLIEFGELQRDLSNLRDGDGGELRVSVGSDLAGGAILSALFEAEAAFPGISLSVISDDTTESLRNRGVELAVLTAPPIDDTLEVLHAHTDQLRAHAGVQAGTEPLQVWQLAEHRLLVPPLGTGTRTALSHLMRRHRVEPRRISAMPVAQMLGQPLAADTIAIAPDCALPQPGPKPLSLELGQVQVSILRVAGMPITRPAQTLLAILQRLLEV